MSIKVQLVLPVLLVLQLFACTPIQLPPPAASPVSVPGPTATAAPSSDLAVSLALDESFRLRTGQSAELETAGLTIHFQTVLNDTRCPSQVNCAEAGNATVVIEVWLAGQEPAHFELNINPPGYQEASYDVYQIRLLKLDPYPETIGQVIPQADYRATFVVNPATPATPTVKLTAEPTPIGPIIAIVEADDGPSLEAETSYQKGLTYIAAGLPSEAIANLTEAITLYPAYIEAYKARGDVYSYLFRFDLARADYQQVLALNPGPEMKATVTAALEEVIQAQPVLPAVTVTPTPAPATPLPLPPVAITLNEPFSLALNQYGRLESTGLGVEFYEVIEDIRCPKQAMCESVGWARITIFVWLTNVEPIEFELNTGPDADNFAARYNEYQIKLLTLEPYPETPDEKIALEDYQATFVVSN